MNIRAEQVAVFEDAAESRFRTELVESVNELLPPVCRLAGDAAVEKAVDGALERAGKCGFTLRGPLRLFVETSIILGCGFATDPQLPWAAKTLKQVGRDEMLRADGLHRAVILYADQVFGEGDKYFVAALQSTLAISKGDWSDNADQAQRILTQVYPQKMSALADPLPARLIGEARIAAEECEIGTPLIAVFMCLFGHEVISDPLYPWVGETLGRKDLDAQKKSALLLQLLQECADGEDA